MTLETLQTEETPSTNGNKAKSMLARIQSAKDVASSIPLLVKELKENLEPRVVKDMLADLSSTEVPKEAVLAKMGKLQTCVNLLMNTPEFRAMRPPPPPWGEGSLTLPSTGDGGEGKTVSFQ